MDTVHLLEEHLNKISKIAPSATVRKTTETTWVINLGVQHPTQEEIKKNIEIKQAEGGTKKMDQSSNVNIFNNVASAMQQMFEASGQEAMNAVEKAKAEMKALEAKLLALGKTTEEKVDQATKAQQALLAQQKEEIQRSVQESIKRIEEKAASFALKVELQKNKEEQTALLEKFKTDISVENSKLTTKLDKFSIDSQRQLDEQSKKLKDIFLSATKILG